MNAKGALQLSMLVCRRARLCASSCQASSKLQDAATTQLHLNSRRAHVHAGRGVPVAQEEGEDVVVPVVARLGDQAQIWRVCTPVGIARALLVGVRPA